ncbi:DUF2065 domain-containing protein [Rehaibacterium terrae]|jgi:uncharacterized protein YjeT (DUF2065 family)|uniref:DUF2065 domain-containing protein n=1 Tax=Rehaibacterium terrae TaxID=1341696 RepID=A0A7W7Y040_9GAMM|nr:DUF2065 family protein [Rehaibacterium terrae]MBB5015636.1 hypothetical protein [Rehaibacterium terrae]
MLADLLAALCLVLVIEGLFLFVAPQTWKQAAAQLIRTHDRTLRTGGAVMIVLGLLALQFVR